MIGRHTTLECDGNYVINLENEENIVNISNLNFYQNILTSPVDGKMDVFVQSLKRKIIKKITVSKSHLTAKDIRITSQKPMHVLLTDEKKIIKTPATIKTIAKKIKIVVGRNRQY